MNAVSESKQPSLDLESLTRLQRVARAQRGVLICVVATLAWPLFQPLFLIVLPFRIFFAYRLASASRIGYPPIWAAAMFIPFLDILMLLLLAQHSSRLIREAGFSVGLTGADLPAIEAALADASTASSTTCAE